MTGRCCADLAATDSQEALEASIPSMTVHLRSLGYRTDLIFPSYDGQVADRGDYLVVRTPSNPTFYWGNFLLFRRPPDKGDERRWRKLFADEVGHPPRIRHEAFGWDSPDGERGLVQPFLDAGFTLVTSRVLGAQRPKPPEHRISGVVVRPLGEESEWEQALSLQLLCNVDHEPAGYRVFRQRQMARYRAMDGDGRGHWFGAFVDDAMVADLGVFHDGDLARFQSVETHPEFRRRGIAGTLVYEASKFMVSLYPTMTLVIVADEGSAAERLYRSLGFQPLELQMGLERWEPSAKG